MWYMHLMIPFVWPKTLSKYLLFFTCIRELKSFILGLYLTGKLSIAIWSMALVSQDFYPYSCSIPESWSFIVIGSINVIGQVNVGIICFFIANCQSCLHNTQSTSDWLLNAQSRVLQAGWLVLESNEKATLNISMSY